MPGEFTPVGTRDTVAAVVEAGVTTRSHVPRTVVVVALEEVRDRRDFFARRNYRIRRCFRRRHQVSSHRIYRWIHPCPAIFPVGIVNTVVEAVDDTGRDDTKSTSVPTSARRHLFISSDIRIKAFTFNQN